jgi:DNA-binding MarR family transcriptional regulator
MFEQCLYFNTTALARLLEREWTQAFKPFGLTPSQAFMLRVVLDKGGLLHSHLADEMSLTRSTVSRTVDGLEKLGLIVRAATGNDGRETEIRPTAKAQALKDKINAASAEVTKKLKKMLGAKEFESAVLQMRNISASIR